MLPGITDSPASLDKVVRAAKEAGAKYVYANALFLKPCSASVFLPFLEKEFPELVESYRKRYERPCFRRARHTGRRLSAVMSALRKKHGIRKEMIDRKSVSSVYRAEDVQMALFG